uniref:Putative tick cytotoxin family protein n=1 Tax=Ixodes ricinus TaxID=34613 RepID=A0A090X7R3_IXORI
MAKSTQLIGAAVLLTLGLQVAAAGTVFNLEDKIKAYAERLAQHYKTKVVWWDTHGEKLFHPKEKYSTIGFGLGGALGRIMVAKQLERFKLNIKTGMNLTAGVAGEYTESETLSIKQQIKTPPNTSAKIEWIVVDEVKEIPWTADITIQGWFAVCLDKQINGKYVHFPKITVLQDPDLKKNQMTSRCGSP